MEFLVVVKNTYNLLSTKFIIIKTKINQQFGENNDEERYRTDILKNHLLLLTKKHVRHRNK